MQRPVPEILQTARFDDDAVLCAFLDDVRNGTPASLIRLSDGEAKLIGFPDGISEDTVRNQLRIWFGERDLTETDIVDLQAHLLHAVRRARYLCLPQEKRTLATDEGGTYTRDARQCQAMWQKLEAMDVLRGHATLGSAMIHRYAQITRWFATLLQTGRPVVFVTRTRIAVDRLVAAFDIRDYHVHLIPGETWSRKEAASHHYPDRFREVRAALARSAPGAIGLVGGGALGKIYCTDIAAAGGMAFDCGALFDTWADDIPKERRPNMPGAHKLSVAYLCQSGASDPGARNAEAG